MSEDRREPIAIVGMACLFPGADRPDRFWQNIVDKVTSIGEPPPDWQPERFLEPAGDYTDLSPSGRGGHLGDLARFNPIRFGVPPKDVDGAEPDQFLALRCAVDALEDAGFPDLPMNRERASVIIGRGVFVNRGVISWITHTYVIHQVGLLLKQLEPDRSDEEIDAVVRSLKEHLPTYGAQTVPGLVNNVIAGRVANKLDLAGPAYTLDAACASSLLAVEQGIDQLRSGTADVVVAGAMQLSTPGLVYSGFSLIGALSPSGKLSPLSEDSDGTMLGQGAGMLVLKRLSDAERDGNRIYALVHEVGSSSDGKGSGLLAPRSAGQVKAIRRAYEKSGIDPDTIELVEAHATGIPLGDATEMTSLREVFPEHAGAPRVAIGSCKSNLGHMIPASGMASIMKTAMALHHRVLPPQSTSAPPHPKLELDETRFYLNTELRPWVHGTAAPRRAAINGFGFGGINAHGILEEYVPPCPESELERFHRRWPAELVLLSAADRAALSTRATQLAAWIDALPEDAGVELLDIAAACARERGATRVAIVARDLADLRRKLDAVVKRLGEANRDKIQDRGGVFWYAEPLAATGRVATVFPGEGAQYVNMLRDLCLHFPEARYQLDLTDRGFLRRENPWAMSPLLYPPPGREAEAERQLLEIGGAVTSVTAASRALMAVLDWLGVNADAVLGHSSGEFGALLAAGVFQIDDEESLLQAIADGGDSAEQLYTGGLAPDAVLTAVGGIDPAVVESVVAEAGPGIVIAMDNCPSQLVLVGDEPATARAMERLKGKGGLVERLPWGRPYHTEAFAPAARAIDDYYRIVGVRTPRTELWSCATAGRFPDDPDAVRELAVRQWAAKVRFTETVRAMHAEGIRVFVEVGPRGNLSAFIDDILRGEPHVAVPLDNARRNGVEQLCRALGQLAAHGVDFEVDKLYARRRPRELDLGASFQPERSIPRMAMELPELVVSEEVAERFASNRKVRIVEVPAPEPARPPRAPEPEPAPRERAGAPLDAPSSDAKAQVMIEFQRTMRQFLDVQQNVMMRALEQRSLPAGAAGEARRLRAAMPSLPGVPGSAMAAPAAEPAPESVASPPAAAPGADGVPDGWADRLRAVVEQSTGYPPDMLELEADLERDLGIEPRKRAEIVSRFHAAVRPGVAEPGPEGGLAGARTLRRILEGVAGVAPGPAAAPTPAVVAPSLPFVGERLEHVPGKRLVAECRIDPDSSHRFLLDHTFFGRPSITDRSLTGVPVMPMAMTFEVMAEAATVLGEGLVVAAVTDIEALGWLSFENGAQVIRVEATREGDRVAVTVGVVRAGHVAPVSRGVIELGGATPSLGAPRVADRARTPATGWGHDIYDRTLYNGPPFAGIVRVDRADEQGVRGVVRQPDVPLEFEPGVVPSLVLPVAMLDTASQIAGLVYGGGRGEDQKPIGLIFPNRVGRIELDRTLVESGELDAIVEIRKRGRLLDSDIELVTRDGRVAMRIEGRTDEIVEFPGWVYFPYLTPSLRMATQPIAGLFADVPGADHLTLCEYAYAPQPVLRQPPWLHVLARAVLGRAEREELARTPLPPAVRVERIIGRATVKDAVRRHLDLDVGMADVRIHTDRHGRPEPLLPDGRPGPAVSLAHKAEHAVAVAVDRHRVRGVGIDSEPLRPLPPDVMREAFSEAERAAVAPAGVAGPVAAWCAKEAVGKALGQGVQGGPRGVEVTALYAASGRVRTRLRGPMVAIGRAAGVHEDDEIEVHYRLNDGRIIALCVLA